ncbi:polymer-forming cytoskeletal protein [Pseudoclavibacter sp. 13-3]|uniref:polymer-forming cytoskeletal protein n=1 Tax=Pseudoclavibacter sp. 13-3 TaxID=2901228 RepID=UPI001E3D5C20|nr:polymer-forming cytoskeletal protein [Pseudoclavibacter sp. 13-3]MCD7101132.1 polymer-forming cytoskeletal protein [Pseudoclavibacter sp. 13-3]
MRVNRERADLQSRPRNRLAAAGAERGASLVTVIAFTAVLLLATALMTTAGLSAQRTSADAVAAATARANANSGIEAARVFFATSASSELPTTDACLDLTTLGLAADDVCVRLTAQTNNPHVNTDSNTIDYAVTSVGKSSTGAAEATASATFTVSADAKPAPEPTETPAAGIIQAGSALTLPANMTWMGGGTLASPGDIACNTQIVAALISAGPFHASGSECRVTGDVWAGAGTSTDAAHTDTFICDQNTVITGNVYTTGRAKLSGQCQVTGQVYAQGDVSVTGNAQIGGTVHTAGGVSLQGQARIGADVFAQGDITLQDTWSSSPRAVSGSLITQGRVSIANGTGIGTVSGTSDPQTITGGQIWAGGDVTFTNAGSVTAGSIHSGGTVLLDKAIVIGDVYSRWDIESKTRITGSATSPSGAIRYNRIDGSAQAMWDVAPVTGADTGVYRIGGSAYSMNGSVTANTVGKDAWGFWTVTVNNSAGGSVVAYGSDNGSLVGSVVTGQGSTVGKDVTARYVTLGRGAQVGGNVVAESLNRSGDGNATVAGKATLKYQQSGQITVQGGTSIVANSPAADWNALRSSFGFPTTIALDPAQAPTASADSAEPVRIPGIDADVVTSGTVQTPKVSAFTRVNTSEQAYSSWVQGVTRHIFSGANACSDAEDFLRAGNWSGPTRVEVYNCSDDGQTQMFSAKQGWQWQPIVLHGDLTVVSDSGFRFPGYLGAYGSTFQSDSADHTFNLNLIVPADAQTHRDVPDLSNAATMPSGRNAAATGSIVSFDEQGSPTCATGRGSISSVHPLSIASNVHLLVYTPCQLSTAGFAKTDDTPNSAPGAPYGQLIVGSLNDTGGWDGQLRLTFTEMPYPWLPSQGTGQDGTQTGGQGEAVPASAGSPRQVVVTARTSAVPSTPSGQGGGQ